MPTDGVHSPISNKQKHGVARMEDTERPTRLGSGAWGRRQGLAGLRDDAPSEARGADGERAGRRPQAPTRKQAREHKLRGRRAGAPSEARGADAERAGRRPRAPTRKQAREHKLRGHRAGSSRRGHRAGSSRRGRRTGSSQRGLRDDTPSEAHGADAERAGRRPQAPTRRTRAYNEAGASRAKQRRGPRPRETVRPGGPP